MNRRELILRKALEKYASDNNLQGYSSAEKIIEGPQGGPQGKRTRGESHSPPLVQNPKQTHEEGLRSMARRATPEVPGYDEAKWTRSPSWTSVNGEFADKERVSKLLETLREQESKVPSYKREVSNPEYEPYRTSTLARWGVPAVLAAAGGAGGWAGGGALGTIVGGATGPLAPVAKPAFAKGGSVLGGSLGAGGGGWLGRKGIQGYEALQDSRTGNTLSHVADQQSPEVREWLKSPEGKAAVRTSITDAMAEAGVNWDRSNPYHQEIYKNLKDRVTEKVYREELGRRLRQEEGFWDFVLGPAPQKEKHRRVDMSSELVDKEIEQFIEGLSSGDVDKTQADYNYTVLNNSKRVLNDLKTLLHDRPVTKERLIREIINRSGKYARRYPDEYLPEDSSKSDLREHTSRHVLWALNQAGENE